MVSGDAAASDISQMHKLLHGKKRGEVYGKRLSITLVVTDPGQALPSRLLPSGSRGPYNAAPVSTVWNPRCCGPLNTYFETASRPNSTAACVSQSQKLDA